jgi:hypothetical protein
MYKWKDLKFDENRLINKKYINLYKEIKKERALHPIANMHTHSKFSNSPPKPKPYWNHLLK